MGKNTHCFFGARKGMEWIFLRTRGQLPKVNFTANKQDLLLSNMPKTGL